MYSDLHIHTLFSDGTKSPSYVIKRAAAMGLDLVSVTDHDSVAGLPDAAEEARKCNVPFINGVELSVSDVTEVHILGYGMNTDGEFEKKMKYAASLRETRNEEIIARLNSLGIGISVEDLNRGKGVKGRMHIARILCEKGITRGVNEAFDEYLGKDGKAYVPSMRLSAEQAIDMIVSSGGIAVLAHPSRFRIEGRYYDLLEKLVSLGLGGIEAFYPTHSKAEVAEYVADAEKYGLIVTGGSDYHGDEHGAPINAAGAILPQKSLEALMKKRVIL